MNKFAFHFRILLLTFFMLLTLVGCEFDKYAQAFTKAHANHAEKTKQDAIDALASGQLSIRQIDDLMDKWSTPKTEGVDLISPVELIDSEFIKTPTGAYIDGLIQNKESTEKISAAAQKLINHLGNSPVCRQSCSENFKDLFASEPDNISDRLADITTEFIKNEIRNREKYTVFYHGFPNDFRLYQDVLRAVKSFEYVDKLDNTYPFRDFAFNDEKVELSNFLKDWWNQYLEYAKEKNQTPFASDADEDAPGKSVGLTFYPDSISYAQNYLLATNVNFFGNSISPMNSSVFFLINSTSATGLDIVNWLIEKTLTPYLKNQDGKLDRAKFDSILAQLKTIFNRSMAKSGGQIAQIFVKNDVAPEISFMSWNGGEPMWISKKSGAVIFANDEQGQPIFKPTNVFWPTTKEQIDDYQLSNVPSLMTLFVDDPKNLLKVFFVTKPVIISSVSKFLGDKTSREKTSIFASRDYLQARILPNPKYFTDELLTGTKILTQNFVAEEDVKNYEREIFDVIRDLVSDFIARAKSAHDFKEGDYLLKKAFLATQQNL